MHCLVQEPGERYEYQLRGLSDPLSFRASPRPGPSSIVSFVVYGDMGESDHARAKSPGYTHMLYPPPYTPPPHNSRVHILTLTPPAILEVSTCVLSAERDDCFCLGSLLSTIPRPIVVQLAQMICQNCC